MPEPIEIATALLSERHELEGLQRRASLANPGDRDAIIAHPDAIAVPDHQIASGLVFVARQSGVLVGFAALLVPEHGDADLDALFVEPSLWRRGIGRRLLAHCEAQGRLLGATGLRVVANPHAQSFYRSSGYELSGLCPTRFGAAMVFRKRLAGRD